MKDLDLSNTSSELQITANNDAPNNKCQNINIPMQCVRPEVLTEIPRLVLRKKLAKMRHLVIEKAISPSYLDHLFPKMLELFDPQTVIYNGGIAKIKEWKISCYLEVMDGGVPCTNPNIALLNVCRDLLDNCNLLFATWYRQQHPLSGGKNGTNPKVKRIMTFITRYTAAPNEQALLKVR